MKYFLYSCAFFILILSCTRRPQEFVSFTSMNNSSATVKLFLNTSKDLYNQYSPEQGVQKSLTSRVYGSTQINEANFNKVFTLASPIKVVFNDIDTVLHYNDSEVHSGKYLNLLSNRCLFNIKSYVINKEGSGDVGIYTFTESDYEFAKQ